MKDPWDGSIKLITYIWSIIRIFKTVIACWLRLSYLAGVVPTSQKGPNEYYPKFEIVADGESHERFSGNPYPLTVNMCSHISDNAYILQWMMTSYYPLCRDAISPARHRLCCDLFEWSRE